MEACSGRRTDQLDVDAAFRAANAAPFGAVHLEINRDHKPKDEEYMKNQGIDEKFSKAEVFGRCARVAANRIGDGGGHG